MKKICFLLLYSLFSCVKVTAQNSLLQLAKLGKAKPAVAVKFIDAIEFNPEASTLNVVSSNTETEPLKAIATPLMVQNGIESTIEHCAAIQFKYALLMNREVELYTNIPLYHFIDEWWATRYHYGGADKSGIDCSAFAGKLLGTIYGVTLARTSAEQYNLAEKVTVENLQEGDLVFFKAYGAVNHVGVYLGDHYFVHSSVHAGVTISSLTDEYYSHKFIGGGRAH